MQKSKLYARTDYESTIYSICMHQNLLFFMEKLPKMAVSWSKNKYFGLRQAVAEPAPPILRVLDAKKHAVWTHRLPKHNLQHSYAPKSAIFQQNRRKIAIFLSKFFFSLKQAAEPPPLPIGGCSLQKSEIRQRTT